MWFLFFRIAFYWNIKKTQDFLNVLAACFEFKILNRKKLCVLLLFLSSTSQSLPKGSCMTKMGYHTQMIDPNKTENLWMRFAPPSASGDFQKRCRTALCLVRGLNKTERNIMSSSAPFSERGNGSCIISKTSGLTIHARSCCRCGYKNLPPFSLLSLSYTTPAGLVVRKRISVSCMETRKEKKKIRCLFVFAAARIPQRQDTALHQNTHSQLDDRELLKSQVRILHVSEPFATSKRPR